MGEAAKVIDFKLPKKPKVVEKEAPPDQRSVAVMPIRALTDKQLTDGNFRALGLLCSYCNRAGITWVSQKRLAEDMGITRQGITKHLAKLRALGYVEITKKGFRGERANTLRVIFDASIKAEDAVAITSSIEDTRPPEMIKADKKAAQRPTERLAADGLPEMSEEQAAANRKRLKDLLQNWSNPNFRTHQPQPIGDIIMATQKQSHRQPNTVANEGTSHRQPGVVKKGSHRQPHRQPNEVAQNTEEHKYLDYLRVFKEKGFNVLGNQIEIKLLSECMSAIEAQSMLQAVAGRYQAEGLQLPTNLAILVEDMIATNAARHLEGSQSLS